MSVEFRRDPNPWGALKEAAFVYNPVLYRWLRGLKDRGVPGLRVFSAKNILKPEVLLLWCRAAKLDLRIF